MIGTLLSLLNVVIALALIVLDVRYYRSTREPWRWVKLAYALVGLYWLCVYLVVLFTAAPPAWDPVWFGQVFIRPAITVTLAVMCAGAIIRARKS